MFKKLVCLTVALMIVVLAAFADDSLTRQALERESNANQAVLAMYDETVEQWIKYAATGQGEWDLDKLLRAVEFAAKKHRGQYRKDAAKTPYIVHPIGVARLLWEEGEVRSVNVLVAALLHDTLEDTDATEEEIAEFFGDRVLYTIKEVTNDPNLSGEENKPLQILHAPGMSLDGQLVKLADRLYNVRDLRNPPPAWSVEKIDAYYGWGEKLLNALRGTNAGLERALLEEIIQYR